MSVSRATSCRSRGSRRGAGARPGGAEAAEGIDGQGREPVGGLSGGTASTPPGPVIRPEAVAATAMVGPVGRACAPAPVPLPPGRCPCRAQSSEPKITRRVPTGAATVRTMPPAGDRPAPRRRPSGLRVRRGVRGAGRASPSRWRPWRTPRSVVMHSVQKPRRDRSRRGFAMSHDITRSQAGFSIDGGHYVTLPRASGIPLDLPPRTQRISPPADRARSVAWRATSSVMAAIANSAFPRTALEGRLHDGPNASRVHAQSTSR
ncbi:hypothetical protein HDA42_006727 [Streptomyces costaricanus]|uniref:Uncharacterized protein n=1 Tax=Streptomyces murinus TaxID=33900 RepID=A0A7W3NVP5_STRMR|nr:hypothetical protein [Streptomyces murinus]